MPCCGEQGGSGEVNTTVRDSSICSMYGSQSPHRCAHPKVLLSCATSATPWVSAKARICAKVTWTQTQRSIRSECAGEAGLQSFICSSWIVGSVVLAQKAVARPTQRLREQRRTRCGERVLAFARRTHG